MSDFAPFATGAPQSSRPALGRLGSYRGWLLTPFHQVRVYEVMNGTWAPSPTLGDSIQTHVYDQSIQMVPEKLIQPPTPVTHSPAKLGIHVFHDPRLCWGHADWA